MILSNCRACNSNKLITFFDLGPMPISNNYLHNRNDNLDLYDLKLMVCENCSFMQLSESHDPKIHFNDAYPYFSGYSKTWIEHCRNSAANLRKMLKLKPNDFVIELASNDGTFIKEFKKLKMKVLGIEPSANVAKAAMEIEIETINDFFTDKLSIEVLDKYGHPDLILGCNVLAHVPNLHSFILGVSRLMSNTTVACFEFPHASRMIQYNQFDTIYHEHYSYLNLMSLIPVFTNYNLQVHHVEEIDLHGGSLRIHVSKLTSQHKTDPSVQKLLKFESKYNPLAKDVQEKFSESVNQIKDDLNQKIVSLIAEGKRVIIFGAAAKGTTLLNFSKIDYKMIEIAIDSSIAKQNKFIPGTGIKIYPPEILDEIEFDCVLILAWNFASEIISVIRGRSINNFSALIPIPYVHESKL